HAAAEDVAIAAGRSSRRCADVAAGAGPLRGVLDRSRDGARRLCIAATDGPRTKRGGVPRTQLLLGDRRSATAIPARSPCRDAGRPGQPDDPRCEAQSRGTLMPVLSSADRAAIADAFADASRLVVVSLCAAWCDTCTQFRAAFARVAQARPQTTFVWLDIED